MPVELSRMKLIASRLRKVERAASELRRGVPVVLCGHTKLLILGAETAGKDALDELQALCGRKPQLILAPSRVAGILRSPNVSGAVAVEILNAQLTSQAGFVLADPILPQRISSSDLQGRPALPHADAAIKLAKIGRLLPAITGGVFSAPNYDNDFVEVSVADIFSYFTLAATGLRQIVSAEVPLRDAPNSRVVTFRTDGSGLEHLAIIIGRPEARDAPLVRIHSECFTGDLLGSLRCDCGEQLRSAIRRMAKDGAGVLLYLSQEGRGIGLANKLRTYCLQDRGFDTMDANRVLGWGADERDFTVGAEMLRLLGLKRVRILTNNLDKVAAMASAGINVVGREPHIVDLNELSGDYIATKAVRFGHVID